MGKWLAKFSSDSPESLPDITDTLPSVSGLSGPDLESLPEIAGRDTSTGVPTSLIQPGWLVTYRAPDGRLQGGDLDRHHGALATSAYGAHGWIFTLTDGQAVHVSSIRGVSRTVADGRIVAAWTVREHGLDGEAQ